MASRHHPSHKRKRFCVIFDEGGKHQMPQALFDLHVSEGRILISRKDEFRASINPRYTAWVEKESGLLMFRVRQAEVAPYSISSSWLALMRAYKYQAPFNVWYWWWRTGIGERPEVY